MASPVTLERVRTKDGLSLDGAFIAPRPRNRAVGVLSLHGLTSSFYRGQGRWLTLAQKGKRRGIGVLSLNTRGHDVVVAGKKQKRKTDKPKRITLGTAFEKFEDCIHDIDAGVTFLKNAGFEKVVLMGHSTGAQKAVFYAGTKRTQTVKGIILLGAVSDVATHKQNLGNKFSGRLKKVHAFAEKNGQDVFLPKHLSDGQIITAGRYLSLFKPGSKEDLFPYYNPNASWKTFKKVRVPTLMVLGEDDEYLDRSAEEIIEAFKQNAHPETKLVTRLIPGADHGFKDREDRLAKDMLTWMRTHVAGT